MWDRMSICPPGHLSPGRRIYAVGDVHGCADRLRALHALIAADLRSSPVPDATLVHLGDYIDRGPDSAGVLRLAEQPAVPVDRVVNLAGNHEAMLLDALAGLPGAARHWVENGGDATLESWGIPCTASCDTWRGRIPERDLAMLRGLAMRHAQDGYLLVHAGVRPGVALDKQSDLDLLWIREPFLSWPDPFAAVVVHGHTMVKKPAIRTNRIGIDTGAVRGGPLTCAVLQDSTLRFLQS